MLCTARRIGAVHCRVLEAGSLSAQCGRRWCAGASQIAVLDLSAPSAAQKLDESFRATGFAVVTGHGVDYNILRELREKGRMFFQQPLERKQAFNKRKGYGFGGYLHQEEAAAQLLGDFSKPNDWVESLTLPGGLPRLDGAKREDQVSEVPDIIPGFREVAAEVLPAMLDFRMRLDRLVAEALEVEPELILNNVDPLNASIRLAYYPTQTTPPAPGQLRYGEHVDSGGVTVLIRDEQAPWGTQVRLSNGEWVDVPIVPEAMVLNVGALLSRWTNGRWRASIHRVANDPAERLSIVTSSVIFRSDAEVKPLPSCVSDSSPSRYTPVTANEFLKERVRLHRDSYAEERGLSGLEAEQNLQKQIQDYQM